MKNPKERLDKLLLEKGLADSPAKALALIISGSVFVDGQAVTKPGTQVEPDRELTLKKESPYVSRGGLKLASVFKKFDITLGGKTCLDIGASTGGFTDFMLQNGASKVYAVDVGKNLLHEKLKKDPRVVNIEETNFRYFSDESLKQHIEFVTIDVSFISLDKILPVAAQYLKAGGEMLAMVKPQFEAAPEELKKGVVRDETVRIRTIEKIKGFCKNQGLEILGEADSEIKGPEGNVEHFLWLKKRQD